MDKSTRLSLIKARAALICGASLPALLPVSKAEIRESVSTEIASELVAVERSELHEEDGEFSSTLSFKNVKIRGEDESNILLSAKEKRQLTRDIDFYHAAQRKPFALVLVA